MPVVFGVVEAFPISTAAAVPMSAVAVDWLHLLSLPPTSQPTHPPQEEADTKLQPAAVGPILPSQQSLRLPMPPPIDSH